MSTPATKTARTKIVRKIVVSRYAATVLKPATVNRAGHQPDPVALARIRQRWQAQFVEGERVVESVDGFLTFDDAIGALIRQLANRCETADDVVNLIASLFSDLHTRTADVSLSRAVWIAARHKSRRHPGITVEFPADMEFTHGGMRATVRKALSAKGGAA